MREILIKMLRRVRFIFEPSYHQAWPLHDGDVARPKMNPQRTCPLFEKLSVELRILIYQAVLTDPHRFLHIIKNRNPLKGQPKWRQKWRKTAHFWCIDMESPFPTWQHACYRENGAQYEGGPPGFVHPMVTETDDKLLSLLLSCRIIYSEALPILYRANTFHFRGAPGLLAFRSSISTIQWHSIRNIHLSTFYTPTALWCLQEREWPTENPLKWEKCCQFLCELPNLETLKLDIIFQQGSSTIDSLTMTALEPLKDAKAKIFEVESNVTPSQEAWHYWGKVNFVTTFRERPCNVELYGTYPGFSL